MEGVGGLFPKVMHSVQRVIKNISQAANQD